MEQHSPEDVTALCIRSEASELLGVTDERGTKGAPPTSQAKEKPTTEGSKEKPKAESGATSTGLKLTLDTVNSQWGRILGETKLSNRSVEALLKSCQPVGVEGQDFQLGGNGDS